VQVAVARAGGAKRRAEIEGFASVEAYNIKPVPANFLKTRTYHPLFPLTRPVRPRHWPVYPKGETE